MQIIHVTLPDLFPSLIALFSLEPEGFKAAVEAIRVAEKALGTVDYGINN